MNPKLAQVSMMAACTGLAALSAELPNPAAQPWWRTAVFYEIYGRSFQDSNGDGIGDLAGLTSRLDYLQALGVDALWLTPCYPSPQVDFGYDLTDYRAIDPMFGTLADFDRLVAECRRRGLRIVMDLVLNHTSDQHPWFLDARSSRTARHRDWYIWRDGRGPGRPPNNWLSTFGGSAWQLDPKTRQYYYHFFASAQPDLNWRNPAVREELLEVTRWWYQRGVSGFRLDAVDTLFEDEALNDNPVLPGKNPFGDPNQLTLHNRKLPENQEVFRALRRVADPHSAVLIGETWVDSVTELQGYYGSAGDGLHLAMDTLLATVPRLEAGLVRKHLAEVEASGIWPLFFLSNHDIPRSVTRFGDGLNPDAIAKLLAAMQLTLRGTPLLYYGEELGMVNHPPRRQADVRDPVGRRGWPKEKGRDGQRTPMPWEAGKAGGFTTGKPWLPVPRGAATRNVAAQTKDPASVLAFYRRLLALRKGSRALLEGRYEELNPEDPKILSYLRVHLGEAVLVALNLSPERRPFAPALAGKGWSASGAKVLLASGGPGPDAGVPEALEPYGVFIATLPAAQANPEAQGRP